MNRLFGTGSRMIKSTYLNVEFTSNCAKLYFDYVLLKYYKALCVSLTTDLFNNRYMVKSHNVLSMRKRESMAPQL